MSLSAAEKLEVIRITEESELSVRRTKGIGAGLPIPSAFLQPDPGYGAGTMSGGCPYPRRSFEEPALTVPGKHGYFISKSSV